MTSPSGNQPLFLHTATALLALGLSPVLLDGKKPVFDNFVNYMAGPAHSSEMELPESRRPLRYAPGQLELWQETYPAANVGMLTRDRPCIDIDDETAWPLIADLVPQTPHFKQGARGGTLIYSHDPADPVLRSRGHINRFTKKMVLEVLADGRQTVLPPSIHPDTGQPYQWSKTPWGHEPTPLNSTVPPTLSQRQVDAIEERLRQHGIIKQKVERQAGLGRELREDEKHRYAVYLQPKLAERLAAVRQAAEGGRQDALNGAVFALARWVRAGFITEDWLEDQMRAACGADGNRYIISDGEKAFNRQFEKALDEGWAEELPDLDAGRLAGMGAAPLASGSAQAASGTPFGAAPSIPVMVAPLTVLLDDEHLPDEEPEYIRGIMPATPGYLAFIAGQSQAGKSFVACQLAIALAQGWDFMGRRVYEKTGVVILAAEGAGGYKARLWAAKRERGWQDRKLDIAVIPWSGDLNDHHVIQALLEAIKALPFKVGVIIIDTLSMAFRMDDNNDTAEATAICNVMRSIGTRAGAVVVPVHHFGKDKSKGMVGSQAWFACADYVISCDAEIDPVTGDVESRRLAVAKSREGLTGVICATRLRVVDLGPSARHFGEARTTCVYERDEALVNEAGETVMPAKGVLPAATIEKVRAHLTVHGVRYKWGAAASDSFKPVLEMWTGPLKRDKYERIMAHMEAEKVVKRTTQSDGKNKVQYVELSVI